MTCKTPIGQTGRCLPIRKCPKLIKLMTHVRTSEAVKTYVKRSICTRRSSVVHLCCPDDEDSVKISPNNQSKLVCK